MVDRRRFLGITAAAGASLTLAPHWLRGLQLHQSPQLILRAIPSSGEKLPVIGLGFADHPSCADPAALKEVLKTYYEKGGRVFDSQQSSAPSEQFHATVANELGIQNNLFMAVKGYPSANGPLTDAAVAHARVDNLLAMFKVSKLDVVHIPFVAGPAYWAAMKEEKQKGRIRYLSLAVSSFPPFERVESIMRTEPIDFITVDYGVDRRWSEEKILPLAQELKIAVLTIFPFGGADGASCTPGKGLFARVAGTPLPAWAAEFDATSWAQFFLKYVISHPAVTSVRTGTTKTSHILDNLGGGTGRLPDAAMRKRMADFIDALPAIVAPVVLDRYAGEYKDPASDVVFVFRRGGEKLLMKRGGAAEVALIARNNKRFVAPDGSAFEFQAQGPAVPMVIVEQGGTKTTLQRR